MFDEEPGYRWDTGKPGLAPDALYADGDFSDALAGYEHSLVANPNDKTALIGIGRVLLLEGRPTDAEEPFQRAIDLAPDDAMANHLLAEAYYRQGKFREAALLFHKLHADGKAFVLESLGGKTLYQTDPGFSEADVPFSQSEPLPVVEVSVDGSAPQRFVIDTGAPEITLDTDFAKSIGLAPVGPNDTGTFAGGKKAPFGNVAVDSLTLGGAAFRNIPAVTMSLAPVSSILGGKIAGCIGTVFLYHFLSTIDYTHSRLVIRSATAKPAYASDAIFVPFVMAGDHFMAALGRLDSSPLQPFFIDTGLAGGSVLASKETLERAGIKVDTSNMQTGMGAAGPVKATDFPVERLSLGGAVMTKTTGTYIKGTSFDGYFGFHVGCLISHSFFRRGSLTLDFKHMKLILEGMRS